MRSRSEAQGSPHSMALSVHPPRYPLLMLNQETNCFVAPPGSPPGSPPGFRGSPPSLHRGSAHRHRPLLVFAHATGGGEGVLKPFSTKNWHLLRGAGACVLCDILSGNLHVRLVSGIVGRRTGSQGAKHGNEDCEIPLRGRRSYFPRRRHLASTSWPRTQRERSLYGSGILGPLACVTAASETDCSIGAGRLTSA